MPLRDGASAGTGDFSIEAARSSRDADGVREVPILDRVGDLGSEAVTVVITTKDRREELPRALESALAQDAQPEILVIDDGSSDGTLEFVERTFPTVRVHRNPESVGLIAARNLAAGLARGRVLVSIDDDAAFSTSSVVSQTLEDIRAPGVGAVSIPHTDVNRPDGKIGPRAPSGDAVWVTAVFRGTAYAVRREVFLDLAGFRADFLHQGEEADFCLRLLDAGWWCRVGRADQIHHFESPHRDVTRMEVNGGKNELLHVWSNVPWPWAGPYMAVYAAKRIAYGFRVGRPVNQLRGIWRGLVAIARDPGKRRPVSQRARRLDRRLRRAKMLPLDARGQPEDRRGVRIGSEAHQR